jgi:hypothetical protein
MSIQTACPHCDRQYFLADGMEGSTVLCNNCKDAFIVEAVAAKSSRPNRSAQVLSPGDGNARRTANDADFAVDRRQRKERRPARRRKSGGVLLALLLGGGAISLLLLAGCGVGAFIWMGGFFTKVAEANFEKLRANMTETEVVAILGPPTTTDGGANKNREALQIFGNLASIKALVWENGKNKIQVVFNAQGAWLASAEFDDGKGGVHALHGVKNGELSLFGTQIVADKDSKGNATNVSMGANNPLQGFKPPQGGQIPFPNWPGFGPAGGQPGAATGPSKVTSGRAFVIQNGLNTDQVTLAIGEPPTKKLGTQKMLNGQFSQETWEWDNGKGYLKVHFDKA